jgi:dolichol kinase
LPFASKKKSLEGSLAMFLSSWMTGAITLVLISKMNPVWIFLTSLIAALVAAYTELIAKKGEDTTTVLVASSLVFSFI